MGRASKLIEKLEGHLRGLQECSGPLLQELRRTRDALSRRELAFERLLELIVTAEGQAAAGSVNPKVTREIDLIQGQLKALNRDLDACKAALQATKDNINAIINVIDANEVNALIDDKVKKEQAKGKASQGLKKLQATWTKLLDQCNRTVKNVRAANRILNPKDIPALPQLPERIPDVYLMY